MSRSSRTEKTERLIQALSVQEKRVYVAELHESLQRGDAWHASATGDFLALAKDKDWTVRNDVARLLVHVPDELFDETASVLLSDANAYVRRAAENSKERRRQAHQEAKRASRGVDEFAADYEQFARKHGAELAAEAQRLGERRFELLGGALAHDLLGMLAPLRSHVSAVKPAVKKLEFGQQEAIRELDEGLALFERSLRDLSLYSKRPTVERANESVRVIVRKARDLALNNLADLGVDTSVVTLCDSEVPEITVSVSLHLIVSAVGNLIKNAYEAFGDKRGKLAPGRITIFARLDGAQAVIEIHNSGKGLTEEKLAALRAWLPGRKNVHKRYSTGFGLLNARKNIEEHGGALDFESKPNEGVTAIVRLPI